MYFLYIIKCKDKSLYTGITTDVSRRFKEHKEGVGAHYTKVRGVSRIAYKEKHKDRGSALKREAIIKGWSRRKKLDFITKNKTN